MVKKWIIALSIIGVVLVSGCTDSIICEPDWVFAYEQVVSEYVSRMTEENCKAMCYSSVETTKFKIEKDVPKETMGQIFYYDKCYCDVKKCG